MKLNKIHEEIEQPINEEELLGHISEYSSHGASFFKEGSTLGDAIKHISEIANKAARHIVEREDDWFNKITIKRDAKTIKKLAEELMKIHEQHQAMKQDASALYEDLGMRLQRYYKIEGCKKKKKQLGEDLNEESLPSRMFDTKKAQVLDVSKTHDGYDVTYDFPIKRVRGTMDFESCKACKNKGYEPVDISGDSDGNTVVSFEQ